MRVTQEPPPKHEPRYVVEMSRDELERLYILSIRHEFHEANSEFPRSNKDALFYWVPLDVAGSASIRFADSWVNHE